LAYANENYAESARRNKFIEKTPSFKKLNVDNGIAYYVVANYAEYFGKPPEKGRAKVCGLLLLYKKNVPLISASLYVDEINDPALDLMVKTILDMELVFPNYQSDIIRFDDKNSVKLDIPENWNARRRRGTPLTGINRTYDLILTPPSYEKALLQITVGKNQTGKALSQQQFETFCNSRVSQILPGAVESNATYIDVQFKNGNGKYCILTDASLVNKTRNSDQYLYLIVYFANYNNGSIVYATALADETDSKNVQLMLKTLSSMEPILQ
jgi:hypothetical protein